MSVQRLEILANLLIDRGWKIKNPYSNDVFCVADDCTLCWEIESSFFYEPITIDFMFLDFINPSNKLKDLYSCIESKYKTTHVFGKIKNDDWNKSLIKWVDSLGS